MTIQPRSFLILLAIGLILVPSFASAKARPQGYERDKGKFVSVSQPLGWPVKLQSSVHVNASLDSLPGMAVIRLKPYKPWWKLFGDIPENTSVTISRAPPKGPLPFLY